jgi:hypothetical protein
MQKYLKILHNDLSISNILYKTIKKDITFQYNINNVSYCVPTFGYLFVVIDFEKSIFVDTIVDQHEKKLINQRINTNYDFHMLTKLYHRPIKAALRKKKITKVSDLLKLIDNDEHLNNIENLIKTEKQLYTYKNSKNLEKKDKLLYSAILHLIIDNNYINFSEYIDNDTINVIHRLQEMTNNIFLSTEPIDILLNKYFKKYQVNCEDSKIFNINF